MNQLKRDRWNGLSGEAKDGIMQELPSELAPGFAYIGLETFERYGTSVETGVFEYEGRRFVFVPGDIVRLGWNGWQQGMDEATREDLLDALGENGVEEVDAFLREQMTPVREVVIGPMLAECETHSAGWREISAEDVPGLDDSEMAEQLERFKKSDLGSYELYESYRLKRVNGVIRVYLYEEDVTCDQWREEAFQGGFSLPTEDEWEYMYGGGCRTLFPWGDSFDYSMKLKYFEELGEPEAGEADGSAKRSGDGRPYDLELPNAFGLIFAGDPYQYELTECCSGLMPKGGDGGSMICGGMGPVAGYLPAAAVYYRDPYNTEAEWEDLKGHSRYRRIVRLSER